MSKGKQMQKYWTKPWKTDLAVLCTTIAVGFAYIIEPCKLAHIKINNITCPRKIRKRQIMRNNEHLW